MVKWTGPMKRRSNEGATAHPRFSEYHARARLVAGQLQSQVQLGKVWTGVRTVRVAPDAVVRATVMDNFEGQPIVNTSLDIEMHEKKVVRPEFHIPKNPQYDRLRFGGGTEATFRLLEEVGYFGNQRSYEGFALSTTVVTQTVIVEAMYCFLEKGADATVALYRLSDEPFTYADGWGDYNEETYKLPTYGWQPEHPDRAGENEVGGAEHPDEKWYGPYFRVEEFLGSMDFSAPNLLEDSEYPNTKGLQEPIIIEPGTRIAVALLERDTDAVINADSNDRIEKNSVPLFIFQDPFKFVHLYRGMEWSEEPWLFGFENNDMTQDSGPLTISMQMPDGINRRPYWDLDYVDDDGNEVYDLVFDADRFERVLHEPEDWVGVPVSVSNWVDSIAGYPDLPNPDLSSDDPDELRFVPHFGIFGQMQKEQVKENVRHTPIYNRDEE